MPESASQNPWAIIGKIGVVVAILVGLVNLYSFLSPKEARLTCRCDTMQLDLPLAFQSLRGERNRLQTLTGKYELKGRLRDEGLVTVDKEAQADKFATDLSEAIAKSQTSAFDNAFDRDRTIVTCKLSNTGRREAKDVIFKLPFTVAYAQIDDAPLAPANIDRDTIKLGAVKPGVNIGIKVWSDGYSSPPFSSDRLLLTFEDGSATVDLSKNVSGAAATVASIAEFVTVSRFVTVFFLATGVLMALAVVSTAWQAITVKIRLAERDAVDRYIEASERVEPTENTEHRAG